MTDKNWYIVQERVEEPCKILSAEKPDDLGTYLEKKWGPFETKNQAIAKRVGLIRAGKGKPN